MSLGSTALWKTAPIRCVFAFDEDEIRKFTFLYSEKEPARKAERRLRKNYPEAEYLVMKGYGHCGFQMERPEEYAQLMSKEAFSKVERS